MQAQLGQVEERYPWLMMICEGMSVYDPSADKVGVVKQIQLPVKSIDSGALAGDTAIRHVPLTLRRWLLETGYVCINQGLRYPDYYAASEAIQGVVDQRVYLNLRRDELLTF